MPSARTRPCRRSGSSESRRGRIAAASDRTGRRTGSRLGGWGMAMAMLVGAATSAGCAQTQDQAWEVKVNAVAGHTQSASPDAAWTRRTVHAALGRTALFAPAANDEGLELTVEFWELPAQDGSAARDLVVELELESPSLVRRGEGPESLVATVMLERRGGSAADLQGDLQLATGRAVTVLDARTRLALGTAEQVAALLRSGDPDLILLALEWVDDQDARGHANEVAAALLHADKRVRMAAVATLGKVGGPAQVHALIAQLRLADAGDAEAAYRALASMGGADAEAFLRFAAENEDDPNQRRAALMALRSLRVPGLNGRARSRERLAARSHRR